MLVLHARGADEREALVGVMEEAIERHIPEMGEIKMTGAQALLAEGRAKGREEGREEGRRELLLQMLIYKFGPVTRDIEKAVDRLSNGELKDVARRSSSANTIEELHLI